MNVLECYSGPSLNLLSYSVLRWKGLTMEILTTEGSTASFQQIELYIGVTSEYYLKNALDISKSAPGMECKL